MRSSENQWTPWRTYVMIEKIQQKVDRALAPAAPLFDLRSIVRNKIYEADTSRFLSGMLNVFRLRGKRLKQRVFLAGNFMTAPVVVTGDYIVGVVTESAVRLHFDADEISCKGRTHLLHRAAITGWHVHRVVKKLVILLLHSVSFSFFFFLQTCSSVFLIKFFILLIDYLISFYLTTTPLYRLAQEPVLHATHRDVGAGELIETWKPTPNPAGMEIDCALGGTREFYACATLTIGSCE
ncbi:hypothetical protein PUN28_008550 [Cardiocondyla obscurior]|uniref:Uncharacterized protein n=1 Tax=Cardiocondyla obscurior TaxID=286306 RepID=A0AAW2G050_9HYME